MQLRYNTSTFYHFILAFVFTTNSEVDKVLARPYLMTFYVIFPIQVNFPVTSTYVLKATIDRKKTVNCFTLLEKVFFC